MISIWKIEIVFRIIKSKNKSLVLYVKNPAITKMNSNLITFQSVWKLQMLLRYNQCFRKYWNNINRWMNMNMQVITGYQQGLSQNQLAFWILSVVGRFLQVGGGLWGKGALTSLTLSIIWNSIYLSNSIRL